MTHGGDDGLRRSHPRQGASRELRTSQVGPALVIEDQTLPLVTVVTPFYNTAEHLDECIESVLAQSHRNLEYILQDNASDDGASEIAKRWAARDARIRYFRLDSLIPQVPNYNLALTRVSPASAYTKIVQADDWIYPDCLRQMVALGERSPRIGLISSYRLDGDSVWGHAPPHRQAILTGREVARLHLLQPLFLFGSPTTVMMRSEVVRARRPFYAEGRLHEDTEACYEILREWDFGFVPQVLSYSRVESGSTYGQMQDFDTRILDKLIVLHRYGREFLSASEFETRVAEIERRYYRRLARAIVTAQPRAYWEFQKRGLATQGLRISLPKLARGLGRELLSLLACPQELVGLAKAWTRRRHK